MGTTIITEAKKISQLEKLEKYTDNTMIPAVDEGETKQISAKNLMKPVKEEIKDLYEKKVGKQELEAVETVVNTLTEDCSYYPVTMADVRLNTGFTVREVELGTTLFSDGVSLSGMEGHCYYVAEVKKGDVLVLTNAFNLESDSPYMLLTNKDHIITELVDYGSLKSNTHGYGGRYIFEEDRTIHVCFDYTTVQAGEFFYIKHPSISEPLVLCEDKAAEYEADASVGDKVLNAIMKGRQILVRVPNADGNNYTVIYSPVYMYQLPNYMNEYLYLFYLKDEKQDLTDLIGFPVKMPVYGELKLKLSHTYNMTPL